MEPKLRKIWIEKAPEGSNKELLIKDPLRLAEPFFLDELQLKAIRLLDGKRDIREIQRELSENGSGEISRSDLKELVSDLDRRGFLDTERFRTLYRNSTHDFEKLTERPYIFHGECYPDDPYDLDRLLAKSEEPNLLRSVGWRESEHGAVTGIIAPHIDPSLAPDVYAKAYSSTPEGAPLLYILLGTSHYPSDSRFILTRKDYCTPYGLLQTDIGFVDKLVSLTSLDILKDEILHKTEHSLEFQALYLRYRHRQSRPGAVRIVPILVGSFHDFVRAERYPGDIYEIKEFLKALKKVIDERRRSGEFVVVVAGVDFAHLGTKFGDPDPITEDLLTNLEGADKASLEHVKKVDGKAFFESLSQDGNARRWCGLSPITCLLEIAQAKRGVNLAYGRDYNSDQNYVVTYGAASLHEGIED